jgi:hypothetical protein
MITSTRKVASNTLRTSSVAIIEAVSHWPRIICSTIVASSIQGTGAQK